VTEISPQLRRQLVELYLERDVTVRRAARRHGEPLPDSPRDDWLREITIRARRSGSSVHATHAFLVAQLRPGECPNLRSIDRETLDVLGDVLDAAAAGDIPPE
jgi:transposase-like protein